MTVKWPLILLAIAAFPAFARAGIYESARAGSPSPSPFLSNEKCPFQIRDGLAIPLEFGTRNDGEFAARFAVLANLVDENPRRVSNQDRLSVLNRIRSFEQRTDIATTPLAFASHAADLIRTNQPDKAINVLQPLSRGRTAGFVVMMNLSHAFAAKADWESALRLHEVALDYGAKDDLTAMSPEQVKWLLKVEKKYYRTWLSGKIKNPKPNPATDGPTPLFGPMTWKNDAGQYEPGKLAASERAKLPADAVAIVQQMLFWNPGDTNLYWLLAELYAAEGKLRQAEVIFNQCVNSRMYSGHRILMDHRAAVTASVAKLPPEAPAEEIVIGPITSETTDANNGLPSRQNVMIGLAIATPIVLVLLVFQYWAFVRKLRAGRGRT